MLIQFDVSDNVVGLNMKLCDNFNIKQVSVCLRAGLQNISEFNSIFKVGEYLSH